MFFVVADFEQIEQMLKEDDNGHDDTGDAISDVTSDVKNEPANENSHLDGRSAGVVDGVITLNGWEYKKHENDTYFCCYSYENGQNEISSIIKKNLWPCHRNFFRAAQFLCPVNKIKVEGELNKTMVPTKIALVDRPICKFAHYVPVESVENTSKKNSIGVCAKIIYNEYPSERLIEWMEFMKHMNIDKVMLFTYNITTETKNILDYYTQQNFLIVKEYDYPGKRKHF